MKLLPTLLILSVFPVQAQVQKVAMRTTGISCGLCAGLSEIYFRRLSGVDGVKISRSQEAILLTYQPGATFDPTAIRNILKPLEVSVVQFQIGAMGQAQLQGKTRFFVAGKQTFALNETSSVEVPLGTRVTIEGILDDSKNPMEVKVLSLKPLK